MRVITFIAFTLLAGIASAQERTLKDSILAAKLGPLPGFKASVPLPATAHWPGGYDAVGKYLVVQDHASGQTLTVSMKNGTWEQPRGNTLPRVRIREVDGVWLTGGGPAPFQVPQGARRIEMLRPPEGRTSRGPTLAVPRDTLTWTEVAVWGEGLYAHSDDQAWFIGKFAGRAPFHITPRELQEVERVLGESRRYLEANREKSNLEDFFRERFARSRVGERYRIGVGTYTVIPHHVTAEFSVPVHLPGFFSDEHFISTSFAHDAGQMVNPVDLGVTRLYPSVYFFGELQPSRREDPMGKAKAARFLGLSLSLATR